MRRGKGKVRGGREERERKGKGGGGEGRGRGEGRWKRGDIQKDGMLLLSCIL